MRREEPVEDEVLGEEEEPVSEEEEPVSEEAVEEREEVVVVAKPHGDPLLEYAYGFASTLPSSLGEWKFPWLVTEFWKARAKGDKRLARRWIRLIFTFCPAKPRLCPLYSMTVRCEWKLERFCRPLAYRTETRKRRKKGRARARGKT